MTLEPCCGRCHSWGCRTTICLHDQPQALCDTCGQLTCDNCTHECEAA